MLAALNPLLEAAQSEGYAIGAFNVYNLEGVRAVIRAAEHTRSPVMLQLHPSAHQHGGSPLVALCLEAARSATVAVAVHLDHSSSESDIRDALAAGMTSIMADGSHLPYADNVAFTRQIVELAHTQDAAVEAELGRLSGTEDGLTTPEYEAKLTDPAEAADFVSQTRVDALAVCIGNVHGHYRNEPKLDFARLSAIRQSIPTPLVLHGASGLPESMVQQAIRLGICKFNVNTEVREAYIATLRQQLQLPASPDLIALMQEAETAMQNVVAAKLHLFGSTGKL
jgi:tagatose 1,6-diphosphate aldolase GatY/KbaY